VIWLDPSAYYAPNTETLLNLRFDSGMERSSRWDGETTFLAFPTDQLFGWHFLKGGWKCETSPLGLVVSFRGKLANKKIANVLILLYYHRCIANEAYWHLAAACPSAASSRGPTLCLLPGEVDSNLKPHVYFGQHKISFDSPCAQWLVKILSLLWRRDGNSPFIGV
jgi:hypothetical protein